MNGDPPRGEGRHVARSAAVTGLAQLATMAIGAALAVVILLELGKNDRTDGLLAAYGVYSVVVLFAQSFRTTVVARLLDDRHSLFAAYDAFLGAVLVLFLVAGVFFIVLGDLLATLLTGDLGAAAHDTARTSLAILWPAAGAQLVAALTAGALGVRDDFALPGLAYVLGGVVSIALVLTLSGPLEHTVVSLGVMCGSLLTCLLLLARFAQLGYRPRLRALRPRLATLRRTALMLGGAVAHLAVQLTYVISLAFAARIGPGSVTLYSYAFFAASVVIGTTSGSLSMVLAAPIADTWDRRPRSLDPHLAAVMRAGLMIMLPALGLCVLLGAPAISFVLGSALDPGDAGTIVAIVLALSGTMLASTIEPVPMLAAFASSRYARVASLVLVGATVQIAAAALAVALDRLVLLGVAASLGALVYTLLLLVAIYGRDVRDPLRIAARELVALLVPAAVAFAPAALAAHALGGGAWGLPAAALALAAFLLYVRSHRPQHWSLLQRFAAPATTPRGSV
jgi:peptidoglycan biosynthesis protein MviN/MurJ (putative lipid II flippase)